MSYLDMFNHPIDQQVEKLIEIILKNRNIKEILDRSPFPGKTEWYLGAGCISQTVWNYLTNKPLTDLIKDYDLIYYDSKDLTKESEQKEQLRIGKLFADLNINIEVVNEARVHLWFEKDFGKKINQLESCEDAINRWPTTATCVGVNKIKGKMNVYAPYGLNDMFGMIVRQNLSVLSINNYPEKVKRWVSRWPQLKIIPWE